MTIMEHITSGLVALRAKLSGNDLALHDQASKILANLSPAAYSHCFSDDHSHEAVATAVQAVQAVKAVVTAQIPSNIAEAPAAPAVDVAAVALAAHADGVEAPAAEPEKEDSDEPVDAPDDATDGSEDTSGEASDDKPVKMDEAEPEAEKGPEPTAQTL